MALLPQEEIVEDGQQLEPGGLNAIVLPFSDEVRELKTPENAGNVKTEGKIRLSVALRWCVCKGAKRSRGSGGRKRGRRCDVRQSEII